MDALPIQEATGLDHASRNEGVMHACGHDGHTAMLLAAAHHLARHGEFDGTLNLIFQPAEERGGGAREMMRDGLFEKFPMEAFRVVAGPGAGIQQRVPRDHPRQGGPCRHAAPGHRSNPGGRPDDRSLPDHHQPQQEAA
ncbi:hypothetical protein G6F64_014448 [Rhizopus arrhizus]|uniref:Uncharacterized protein n=1 Tax=Rhizopus oryzae TaxID=64495 RepID=A0A9P7BJT3_RHIOR|nr:hypothetical protein G6F64_014448 [Rhizopus arrhizus]